MSQSLAILLCSIVLVSASAQEMGVVFIPEEVGDSDFGALQEQSPFTRAINLSDSLILTGVALVDDERVATLLNKETKETFVVSSQLNSQGWKMVELKEDSDLEKVAAKVSVNGGEVVTVRYAEWQLKPGESKPGAGSGGGDRESRERDGGRKRGFGPPPEFREKMEKLSEDQRQKLFKKMGELREKNPEMPREERGQIMMKMMDKMLKSK
ncbi:MAG: hypothetical protein CMO55_15670 [Verrucomicrobiales bacterium]|nr:hypothetical protein [Verrucomicrobiales bacterium]